jgi:hypothetical protein
MEECPSPGPATRAKHIENRDADAPDLDGAALTPLLHAQVREPLLDRVTERWHPLIPPRRSDSDRGPRRTRVLKNRGEYLLGTLGRQVARWARPVGGPPHDSAASGAPPGVLHMRETERAGTRASVTISPQRVVLAIPRHTTNLPMPADPSEALRLAFARMGRGGFEPPSDGL